MNTQFEINNIIADRITSNEQIIVESTGVVQSGITISKPSINISNIGDSSFAIDSNIIGVQIVTNSNIDQNTLQYSRAFYGENKHLIASGVANSGNSVAMQFAGMRNFSSSGDAGYLNALYGIAIQYGHNILDSGVAPQTNNIYGLYIEPYNGYGTVNNSYDIFARPAAYLIEDYGVINNAYGIYIQGSHKKHLLEGKLGIGTNNPSYQLDVIGSGNFSQNLLVNGTPVSVSGHTHTSSQITDFNSSISGLLPVKNIIAGSNITVSSTSGIYTINSTAGGGGGSASARGNITTTGTLSSFNIPEGYSVGYLDLFQNGVKLLSGSDFIATDGNSVGLVNSVPSGTVLEYITLLPSISSNNYVKLDNISSSFNGSSTSFGLAVSGTAYYPVSANTLGIYVGGVAQEPIVSYSVSGSNIVFTEAPASGLTFWGVGYGTTAVATLNGIVPGSVSAPAISSYNDLSTGFYSPSSGSLAIASSGYDRFKIDNSGNALFGGQNVDTLRYVDIGNINNSSNAGSILRLVTTNVSGTGNISADLVKYKNGQFSLHNNETNSAAFTSFNVGSSERLRITSSGNVGIGTTVPTSKLHVIGDITANSGNFTNNLQVNSVNVSVSGHSHTVSDIINFNSSVSGLLPITNIIAGNGINVSISGTTAIVTSNDTRWSLFLPTAPTGPTATAENAQVTLSWTAPTGVISQAPITDYIVQYSSNSGSTWTTFTDAVSTATSAVVTGLTNGTSYVFRVAAVNGVGTGAYSTASSAVTPFVPAPVTLSEPYGAVTGSGIVSSKWAWQSGSGFSLGTGAKLLTANSTVTLQATLVQTGGGNCDGGEALSLGIYSAANARIRTMSGSPETLTAGQYIMLELDCTHGRAEVWVV